MLRAFQLLLAPLLGAVLLSGTGCGWPQIQSEFAPLKLETAGANVAAYKVGEDYLAGQLTIEGFENVQKQGIKTVVNLRPEEEQPGFDEKKAVEALGMSYVQIPVNSKSLTPDKADQFLEVMRTVQPPALVHCATANRASGFWALYLAKEKGVPREEAVALDEMSGLKSGPVKTFVENYLDKLPKAAPAAPPAESDAAGTSGASTQNAERCKFGRFSVGLRNVAYSPWQRGEPRVKLGLVLGAGVTRTSLQEYTTRGGAYFPPGTWALP